MKSIYSFIETVCIAFVGGFIFFKLHIPLAWLLGALLGTVVWRLLLKRDIIALPAFRNSSLMVIGYMLGISFTYDTMQQMFTLFPAMATTTVLVIGVSLALSLALAKFTNIPFKTAVIGMMPGGFSQMVILAEEMKDVDVTSVTLFQLVRLLGVIYLVPLIVRLQLFSDKVVNYEVYTYPVPSSALEVVLFIVVTVLAAFIALKMKLPTPYLVGPIIGCALLNISGFMPFNIPSIVLVATQLFLGIHVGKMIDPQRLSNWKVFGGGALVASVCLICSTIIIAAILSFVYPMSLATAFLSAAPGGIAEMGLTAKAIGADLSLVTGFQMFRIFFILFIVPPLIIKAFSFKTKTMTGQQSVK
ncbi:AbrB family transcriptional regulator [Bacillus sp. HMF5848]|uniref:AbrB family transcriptional regulator n=1 Tax=Bacillus sp. HMF5848 TaxID=2495421 RepID=UPI000F7B7F38|nr:AbrB family transcriptional regulator [Bacillus sp. HMF5848]RSK29127.1 AbrB family transcriptional regulator [Bacillus sp. HMF5848]